MNGGSGHKQSIGPIGEARWCSRILGYRHFSRCRFRVGVVIELSHTTAVHKVVCVTLNCGAVNMAVVAGILYTRPTHDGLTKSRWISHSTVAHRDWRLGTTAVRRRHSRRLR